MTPNNATKRNKTAESIATKNNIMTQNNATKEVELKKIKMKWIENEERRKSFQKTGLCIIPVFTVVFTFLYLIVAIVCYM
jgi:hypothetical protein